MNVLVLSHLYPRPHDPSYGTFVHRQVKYLQRLGLDVTVLSPTPWAPRVLHSNPKWRSYGLTPDKVVWEGVKTYYPRYLRPPGAWLRGLAGLTIYAGLLPLTVELHARRPFDVIHSNFLLPDGLASVYLSQKIGLPGVCTVRGSDANVFPFENALNLYFTKLVLRQTEQIVTVSQALGLKIKDFGEALRATHVVYNGVNLEDFQETGGGSPERDYRVDAAQPYILFVGRDIRRKGLKDLLAAFGRLAGCIQHNLVVVGPTVNEVKTLAPTLSESLKDRLIVTGCLPPHQIPTYMQACDLFVLPSYSEGLPNVVLEAMACGKPVVATGIMGIPEAVTDGVTGLLVQPGDSAGLAEAIRSLIEEPARAREMGRLGREKVAKEFTWERNASQMASIYQAAIDAKTATPARSAKR